MLDKPGTIYRDPDLALYRALSCRRGVRYALNEQTKNSALNAVQSYLLFGAPVPDSFLWDIQLIINNSNINSNSTQLGGMFVIVNETVLYEQREQYAGEDLNFEAAVAVSWKLAPLPH